MDATECDHTEQGLVLYNERYDSYFCLRCKAWLSPECDEEPCSICDGRPLTAVDMEGVL